MEGFVPYLVYGPAPFSRVSSFQARSNLVIPDQVSDVNRTELVFRSTNCFFSYFIYFKSSGTSISIGNERRLITSVSQAYTIQLVLLRLRVKEPLCNRKVEGKIFLVLIETVLRGTVGISILKESFSTKKEGGLLLRPSSLERGIQEP